jgi:hypothetical protein
MAGEKTVLPTYDDLAELARICARNARKAIRSEVVAAELWRMATEYQARAAWNVGPSTSPSSLPLRPALA